jgi:pheromone shutdown protein TraB
MMLKATFKIVGLVVVVLVGYPVVHYRAVSPCEMLRKELIWQLEERVEAAAATAAEQVEALGVESAEIEADLESALEGMAAGISAGVAEAKVRRMSTGECTSELWRITIGGEDAYEGGP